MKSSLLAPAFVSASWSRTFWLYGALAVTAWIFCYYRVPETKGRTLEEIESSWRVSSLTHSSRRARVAS